MEKFNKDQEEYTNVKPIQVDYKCPKCGKGYLRPTNMTHGSPDVTYPHWCNNKDCDYKVILPQRYPYIEFVPEDWEFSGTAIDPISGDINKFIVKNPKYANEITITDKTKIKIKT
jgi:DNA-directed RNA polymerase subunit RPC12/RpoP